MNKDEWQTPIGLFNKLNEEFNFHLDVASSYSNYLCDSYLTLKEDAIKSYTWEYGYDSEYFDNPCCWMNPPYSRGNIDKFCKKAYEESQKGCTVVGILPCDCSTKWFQNYVMKSAEIRFLNRRVRFINPDTGKPKGSPTFGSIIVVWKPGYKDVPKVSSYNY